MSWSRNLRSDRRISYVDFAPFFDSSLTLTTHRSDTSAHHGFWSARRRLLNCGVPWPMRTKYYLDFLRNRDVYAASERLIHRRCADWLKERFPGIYETQIAARASDGLSGDFQFVRLWEIANLLMVLKPHSCLEFGTGGSSAMWAELIGDARHFVTVEESPFWHQRQQEYLAPYAGRCTSIQADRVVAEFDGEPVVHYEIDHQKYFDLVYVDGPTNQLPDHISADVARKAHEIDPVGGHVANVDVELMWHNGVFPRIIVIDGRRSTVRRLIKADPGRYDTFLRSGYYAKLSGQVPDYFLYHTVMIRKVEFSREQACERMESGARAA